MKEFIDWLVSIEALAARVYEKALSYFKNDKELSSLIKMLLEDEKVHFNIISSQGRWQSILTLKRIFCSLWTI